MSPDNAPNAHTHAETQLHRHLAHFNAARLKFGRPSPHWQDELAREHECRLIEGRYLEALRTTVQVLALCAFARGWGYAFMAARACVRRAAALMPICLNSAGGPLARLPVQQPAVRR